MRTQFRRTINSILQGRDNSLPPIQTKSFRGIEFIGKEVLKGIREAQSFEDVHLLLSIHLEKIGILDSFSDPIALMCRSNVHVFDANGIAVRLLKSIHHLAQCDFTGHIGQIFKETLVPTSMHTLEIQFSIHILFGIKAMKAHGESVSNALGKIIFGTDVPRTVGEGFIGVQSKGVEIGGTVTIYLVGSDEMGHSQGIGG